MAAGLVVLALVALFVAPGSAATTDDAVMGVALLADAGTSADPDGTTGASGPDTPDGPTSVDTGSSGTVSLPPATRTTPPSGGAAAPPAGPGEADAPPTDDVGPGSADPPGNGAADPPSGGEGGDGGGGDEELLTTLAEAIPVPPDLAIPELPEPVRPLTDAIAPSMFLVCSAAALPGGLTSVVFGLGGDAIPGLGDLVGALLLYQVPILDICTIFGFPDERVECELDDQIAEQMPGAVPLKPPPPVGSFLGVLRGTEGALTGDTIGSDTFLEETGTCEVRPTSGS